MTTTTKKELALVKLELRLVYFDLVAIGAMYTARKLNALMAQLVPGMTLDQVTYIGALLLVEKARAGMREYNEETGRVDQVLCLLDDVRGVLADRAG